MLLKGHADASHASPCDHAGASDSFACDDKYEVVRNAHGAVDFETGSRIRKISDRAANYALLIEQNLRRLQSSFSVGDSSLVHGSTKYIEMRRSAAPPLRHKIIEVRGTMRPLRFRRLNANQSK
jgi:hypothetical protein